MRHQTFGVECMLGIRRDCCSVAAHFGVIGAEGKPAVQCERHLDGVMGVKIGSSGLRSFRRSCVDDPKAAAFPSNDPHMRKWFHVATVHASNDTAHSAGYTRHPMALTPSPATP